LNQVVIEWSVSPSKPIIMPVYATAEFVVTWQALIVAKHVTAAKSVDSLLLPSSY
jgi:hypothetical protein